MLDRGEVKSMAELARLGRRREVGRFDKVHRQIGGAFTGVELHPVLSIARR